jgi:hypothetical protein
MISIFLMSTIGQIGSFLYIFGQNKLNKIKKVFRNETFLPKIFRKMCPVNLFEKENKKLE